MTSQNNIEWTFQDSKLDGTTPPAEIFGFVYLITYADGTKYVGKKQIWMKTKLKPRKADRVNAVRIKYRESKWREYNGSSSASDGKVIAAKEILTWCFTKTMLTFEEAREQFCRRVLSDSTYINRNILGKFYNEA